MSLSRVWGSTVGLLALASLTLTGCAGATPSTNDVVAEQEAPAEEASVEETVPEQPLEVTDPGELAELCGFNEQELNPAVAKTRALMEAPDYWVANFPVPQGDNVYCELKLVSNGLTTTTVDFEESADSLPAVDQWMDEVTAAGYVPAEGAAFASRDIFRAVANGQEVGYATIQFNSDAMPYFSSVRANGESSLQILIQPK